MQITSSYSMPTYHSNEQDIRSQYLKTADLADKTKVEESKSPYEREEYSLPRQTYGLAILEKMSDDEYHAFVRATAEMTESEKIIAAQTFYRLSDLYQEKNKIDKIPYTSQKNNQDFLKMYHNAYQAILTEKQNMQ